jgi:hypothetical protein
MQTFIFKVPWPVSFQNMSAIFQFLTETSMNMAAFSDFVLCSLVCTDRHFRVAYCLHHQGDEWHRPGPIQFLPSSLLPFPTLFLIWFIYFISPLIIPHYYFYPSFHLYSLLLCLKIKFVALMMEAISTSEFSISIYKTTQDYTLERSKRQPSTKYPLYSPQVKGTTFHCSIGINQMTLDGMLI